MGTPRDTTDDVETQRTLTDRRNSRQKFDTFAEAYSGALKSAKEDKKYINSAQEPIEAENKIIVNIYIGRSPFGDGTYRDKYMIIQYDILQEK